jgi:hypothetical protein
MLAFDNLDDRDKKWAAFRASDEWKAYSTRPRLGFFSSRLACHRIAHAWTGRAMTKSPPFPEMRK